MKKRLYIIVLMFVGNVAYGNLEKTQVNSQNIWELTQNTGLSRTARLGGGALTAVETRNSQGLLTNIKTLKGASAIHGIDCEFNGSTGNLKTRKGMNGSESFDYDVLDRLKTVNSSVSGNSKVINYDARGNITYTTGIGAYAQNDAAHKHAVS
ncbi:MAG: hypothetical protein LBH32_03075, partial [Dysgonamonadaceae bacterium]|nr:hypothetical protein [Dysgonamonadaceae bacterium]